MTRSPVEQFKNRLTQARLLGILRDAPASSLADLASCIQEAGLGFVEVALNTPDAFVQIATLRRLLPQRIEVGAGTVLTETAARSARDAGASFLVSPCLCPEVQAYAYAHDLPTLPGAFTPQEVWSAHQAGAALVKLFPAKSAGGPAYVKELRGPFRDIPLLACGGVSPETAASYLASGAQALAFGGSVFAPARLERRDFAGILADLNDLISACR